MKNKNKKNLYKSLILLTVLAIGIGYAYLTSNLSIAGSTEIANNTWDIHFDNLQVTSGSVTATSPATIDSNEVDITYAITLSRPKDFYEFTVDVVNEGTLPGKVSISELSGLDASSSKVVDYTIAYTNGNPVNVGDILNAGATKTIKVRVFYKDNISSTDLPSSNLNLNLTYTLQFLQSEKDEVTTNSLIQQLIDNENTCFIEYDGDVTDEVNNTVPASQVYFNKCADKRNIIFGGYCWQMIRTTETGGIKMIYNGEPSDGKCESSRKNNYYTGIHQTNSIYETLNTNYLYGTSFTYDTTNNTFTLIDTSQAIWSESTYENIIGKYTCMNTTGTCSTIYNVNAYKSETQAYTRSYIIGSVNYAQIGTSSYNSYYGSPAMIGYMFNKVYYNNAYLKDDDTLVGNDVSYSNGTYTLLPASGESELGTTLDDTHHYTCNNTTGTCEKVRYYHNYYEWDSVGDYIELEGGTTIEEALNEMLYNNNVNRYNSNIKGIIDAWYRKNMSDKTNMLEDAVFCNSREAVDYGGWVKNNAIDGTMIFNEDDPENSLSCPNETDQFAISNNKAKLTYPIALLTSDELDYMYTQSLFRTENDWWVYYPYNYWSYYANMRYICYNGSKECIDYLNRNSGVRPVVSLANGAVITGGNGSETNPWIIN